MGKCVRYENEIHLKLLGINCVQVIDTVLGEVEYFFSIGFTFLNKWICWCKRYSFCLSVTLHNLEFKAKHGRGKATHPAFFFSPTLMSVVFYDNDVQPPPAGDIKRPGVQKFEIDAVTINEIYAVNITIERSLFQWSVGHHLSPGERLTRYCYGGKMSERMGINYGHQSCLFSLFWST